MTRLSLTSLAAVLAVLPSCSLAPPGTQEQAAAVKQAGVPYTQPFEKRALPELPADPTWQDVLHRAFLANGDLEAAYFEWAASIPRIHMASTWPNSNLQLGFEYMFSSERMKAWNRTTLSAGFDPSMTLQFPTKVQEKGKAALEAARAAGLRFEAAKFKLQREVLTAWLDYALMAEKVRIARENLTLLQLITSTTTSRVEVDKAPQQDLLKAQIQQRLAQNELASMEADLHRMRAMLNGMLARSPDAPLAAPKTLPAPRPLPADDATLIATAVDRNPGLAALARDVAGRRDALALAKMAYIPDISPTFSINGNISQALGAMVMLPTALPMIEGQIKETRAMLASSIAMARQARSDQAAAFVAALYGLRNAERQVKLYEEVILPAARQVMAQSREAYKADRVGFVELTDSQRTLLNVRQVLAEVRIEREKRLAELEALAGVDVETLGGGGGGKGRSPGSQPAVPGSQPSVPGNQRSVPGSQPSGPRNQPLVPGNQASVPENQRSVPGNQPSVPGNQSSVPGNQPLVPVPHGAEDRPPASP